MLCTSLVSVHLFALVLSLGAGVGLKHATRASLTLLQLHHGVSWSTQIPFVSEGTKQEDAAQHTSCASSGNRHLVHSTD